MTSLRGRMEAWIRDQTAKMGAMTWSPPLLPPNSLQWRWPPLWRDGGRKEQEQRLRDEYELRRKQVQRLCQAIKVETVPDLQDVLCSMILSECVYKRPASEMIRVINKFKADFGGHIVSLECVQPSLDHVPHRYLLAETDDTLFASFIGTKQYKDIITDANILQGVIFHEETEDIETVGSVQSGHIGREHRIERNNTASVLAKPNALKKKSKPSAHRGFLARAKGIPALELYKLAQKKERKLVLCGHSLGGAVAALATLAILRVIAPSPLKAQDKVQIKCITFSQPPVGNAALRDYVLRKGWQQYFKSYCIPEDLVPRILSPAYFHHYSEQPPQVSLEARESTSLGKGADGLKPGESKEHNKEQLVMGLGPVQTSFWRLFKLVPLEGIQKQLDKLKQRRNQSEKHPSDVAATLALTIGEAENMLPSLEIQEGSDGISLAPLPVVDDHLLDVEKNNQTEVRDGYKIRNLGGRHRVPYLPLYVPFGQLFLLGNSSVDFLSDSEYSKLTSVRSVLSELRERFQSHSMKSYRSRFQKIYDLCMSSISPPFLGAEQLSQFAHLQQWLDVTAAGTVELGHIVDSPVIRSATTIVPIGWNGVPGEKNVKPLKVDVIGYGLHLCTLVQAQVNGNWCSAAIESLPSIVPNSWTNDVEHDLQRMRILVGSPLKHPSKLLVVEDLLHMSPSGECSDRSQEHGNMSFDDNTGACSGLNSFVIHCTSDFVTISKEVHFRTRRVLLLGLEGAGKTSLFTAMLGQGRHIDGFTAMSVLPPKDIQQGMVGGVCYLDSAGVNLHEFQSEITKFREELYLGVHDLHKKTDLIVLVHNLAHKVPRYFERNGSQLQPALSLFLNEAKTLGIPWVLAITNKFSVSAHQQNMLINSVMEAYQASPANTEVTNSCPYVMPRAGTSWSSTTNGDQGKQMLAWWPTLTPVKIPFQAKAVMPIEGVTALRKLVHDVLLNQEEVAFEELAREKLLVETTRNQIASVNSSRDSHDNVSSFTAAAIGASLGAGLGVVMAIVMGAASALRKP